MSTMHIRNFSNFRELTRTSDHSDEVVELVWQVGEGELAGTVDSTWYRLEEAWESHVCCHDWS